MKFIPTFHFILDFFFLRKKVLKTIFFHSRFSTDSHALGVRDPENYFYKKKTFVCARGFFIHFVSPKSVGSIALEAQNGVKFHVISLVMASGSYLNLEIFQLKGVGSLKTIFVQFFFFWATNKSMKKIELNQILSMCFRL